MKKLALIVFAIFIAGCVEKGEKVFIVTMKDIMDDFEEFKDNDTAFYYYGLKSYKEGDTIIIRDIISEKKLYGNYTFLHFSSSPSNGFYFDGNLSSFNEGDKVEIKLHVIKDVFLEEINGKLWKIEIEIFKEGWNFQNHTLVPFPPSVIKKYNNKVYI